MELKERRVLILGGKYSTGLILPAWWARAHGLRPGSVVNITSTEDRIIIEPSED